MAMRWFTCVPCKYRRARCKLTIEAQCCRYRVIGEVPWTGVTSTQRVQGPLRDPNYRLGRCNRLFFYVMLKTLSVILCVYLSIFFGRVSLRNLGGLSLCICALGLAEVSFYCWWHASSCWSYRQLLATLSDSHCANQNRLRSKQRTFFFNSCSWYELYKMPFSAWQRKHSAECFPTTTKLGRVGCNTSNRGLQRSVAPPGGQNAPRACSVNQVIFGDQKLLSRWFINIFT